MSQLPEIPGYRITKKLGHGGMADVYLGVQENLAREVAIKVMVPALFRDEQFSARFIKEAQTAAQLAHPNIITIHDVGKAGDSYFIVMEYLPESLSQRMKQQGVLPPEEALESIKKVASALDYAHGKGFIHRDIKPDNIMYREDGTVVLVDFGIARAMDSSTQLTRTGMSIGTPHYMSPEQCRGEKIDGRSDIYSLGVVLHEVLTGEVPYRAENTAGVMIKHLQEPIPRLPVDFAHLQPLFERLMSKDKEKRIQTGEELGHFIDALLTPGAREFMPTIALDRPEVSAEQEMATVVSPHTSDAYVTPPRSKMKKKLVAALMFFFIAAAVAVLVMYLPQFSDEEKQDPPIAGDTRPTEDIKNIQEKEEPDSNIKPAGEETTEAVQTQPPQVKEKPVQSQAKKQTQAKSKPVKLKPEKKKESERVDGGELIQEKLESLAKKVRDSMAGGEPEKALEYLEEARKLRDSPRLRQLERGIKDAVKRRDEKAETLKGQPFTPAAVIDLLALDPELRRKYNDRMKRIQFEIPRLGSGFGIKGFITVTFTIDQNGIVRAGLIDDNLEVQPRRRTLSVKRMIIRKLNSVKVWPPKDKKGKSARLENWRVTFKVGKYRNKINLIKQ